MNDLMALPSGGELPERGAGQNLSFHVMADGDVDRVVFVQLINVDGEVILIITNSLSCRSSVFVDELALYGIYLHRFFFPVVAVGVDALFYDERQGVVFFPSGNRSMRIRIVNH